ncbi:MAG: flagellar filament capping protein FliD [Nitrospinaceae bacterium]
MEKGRKVAAEDASGVIDDAGAARTNKRDLLNGSHILSTRKVPTLEATGPLALFRAADAIKLLSNRFASRKIPLTDGLDKRPRFSELQLSRLQDLRESLEGLSVTVLALLDESAFNTHRAKSSRPKLVDAVAGKNSPITAFSTFSVTPTRVTSNNILVSDVQADTNAALGLTGNFFINGFKIEVEASDTVFDIRDKINFGEDVNKNGVLDLAEDVNGNGLIDILSVPNSESGAGVFITEDVNGNGVLDPSEDANLNDRLDGGTLENRVVANVEHDRLVLRSLAGGSTRIDLIDDDGILLSLGFFETDSKGNPVLKELQFNSLNPPVNLIVEPSQAEIDVEGETFTEDTDIFTDAIEDTEVVIKRASEKTPNISISIDSANTVELIKTFAEQFNNSIRAINEVLSKSLAFDKDPGIQNLRKELAGESLEKTRKANKRNRDLEKVLGRARNPLEVGIDISNAGKNIVQGTAVTAAVRAIRDGMTFPLQSGERKLLSRLTSIGIRTLEDDTLKIDETKLKRALTVNSDEINDLFTDPETGLLPILGSQLSNILKEGSGDIDLKRDEISLRSEIPNILAQQFRSFQENSTFESRVKNLIAVV